MNEWHPRALARGCFRFEWAIAITPIHIDMVLAPLSNYIKLCQHAA